jgi:hypothetical protein
MERIIHVVSGRYNIKPENLTTSRLATLFTAPTIGPKLSIVP